MACIDNLSKLTSEGVKLSDKQKERINTLFNLFSRIENMQLNPDEMSKDNIEHYKTIAEFFEPIKEQKLKEYLDEGLPVYSNYIVNILQENKDVQKQLSEEVLKRNASTNADKINVFFEAVLSVAQKNNLEINNIQNNIYSLDPVLKAKALQEKEKKEEDENKDKTTVIPNTNSASIFGVRPFEIDNSVGYFRSDGYSGVERFQSVYQAIVYFRYVNTHGKVSNDDAIKQAILKETNPQKLKQLYNSFNFDVENDLINIKRWNRNIKSLFKDLFLRSFTEKNYNKVQLENAFKFILQSKEMFKAEDDDMYSKVYSQLLTAYKQRLLKEKKELNRKISIDNNITIDTIKSNPNKKFLIAKESELYKTISESKEDYDNVISIDSNKDIEDSERIEEPESYKGLIEKDDDVVMVFGSNQIGVNDAGSALSAVEQGRITRGEKLINRLSDSERAYGLNTVISPHKPLNAAQIIRNIQKLYETANDNPDKTFAVAYTNTGVEKTRNGYTGNEMITMFLKAGQIPKNIIFSEKWINTGRFGREAYQKAIDDTLDKIKGLVSEDIVIAGKGFKGEGAYNMYLNNKLSELAGKDEVVEDKTVKIMTALSKQKSYEKISNFIIKSKGEAFDYVNANNKYKIEDYLLMMLPNANTFVKIDREQFDNTTKSYNENDIIAQFAGVLHGISMNKLNNNEYYDENEREAIKYFTNWFNRPINSNAVALLYIPAKETFKSESEYEKALLIAKHNVDEIIAKGGQVITLSHNTLSSETSWTARKEDSNKEMWNYLFKRGCKPTLNKEYNYEVWSSEINEEDKEKFKKDVENLQKKLKELKTFEPSITTSITDNIINYEIIVDNHIYGTLENALENGSVVFDNKSVLQNKILEIKQNILNNPDNIHRVKFLLDGVLYYADIDSNNIKNNISAAGFVSVDGSFKRIAYNKDYFDVDITLGNKMFIPNKEVVTTSPFIKLGAEKAKEYIDEITNLYVKNIYESVQIRMADLNGEAKGKGTYYEDYLVEGDEGLIPKARRELQEKQLLLLQSKYSDMSEEDISNLKEEIRALKANLHDLETELKKLEDGKFADLVNNWEEHYDNGTVKKGMEFFNFAVLGNNFKAYAEDFTEEERAEWVGEIYKKLKEYNTNYDNLTDEERASFEEMIKKESERLFEKRRELAREVIDNWDIIVPYVYKKLSDTMGIKVTMTMIQEGQSKEDSSFNSVETNDSDDSLTSVGEEEAVFRENYQSENRDIAKNVPYMLKEYFFNRTVYEKSEKIEWSFRALTVLGREKWKDMDDVYNFLKEKLQGLHTYEEMVNWVDNYVQHGHTEYLEVLNRMKKASQRYRAMFFTAMFTQKANRITNTQTKETGNGNVNKIIDDIKDLRYEKLFQSAQINVQTKNILCEDRTIDLVGCTDDKRVGRAKEIYARATRLRNKLRRANDAYIERREEEGAEDEIINTFNIFKSRQAEDLKICEDVIENIKLFAHAYGISITKSQVRNVVTNADIADEILDVFINHPFTKSNKLTTTGGNYYYYRHICKLLAPGLEDIPQKGTTHAAGKDFATYMYPSFTSILWENLNDFEVNPKTGMRYNQEYIEEHYMKHPIYYKPDNIDEIRKAIEIDGRSLDLLQILDWDNAKQYVINSKEYLLDITGSEYTFKANNGTKYVKTPEEIPVWAIRDAVQKYFKQRISELAKEGRLPENCPAYRTNLWKNSWLEYIYTRKANLNDFDKLRFDSSILTTANGKEYKDLTAAEYMQCILDYYVNYDRRSKDGRLGAFYSPMISDAETGKFELFLNINVSGDEYKYAKQNNLVPLAYAASLRLAEVVKGEIELREALLKKFIHRLEAYNRFNIALESARNNNIDTPQLNYKDFEGYTEVISDFDIEEEPLIYDKGKIRLDGLVFNDDGTLDYEKSKDAVKARIKKLNGYRFNYVQYDPANGTIQEQCYKELHKQFIVFLNGLDKNTTLPGKYGNYKIFKEQKKKNTDDLIEEELNKNNEETAEVYEDSNNETISSETDESNDDEDKNKELENTDLLDESILNEINPAALSTLTKFFYNQSYANTQLQQLFNTSPSFYKGGNPVEVQKRGKEHNTPMQRLDIEGNQLSIHLLDLKADTLEQELYGIFDSSENLSEIEKKNLKNEFKGMKLADGQAFRTPESYIKIQKGLGRWTDEMQEAFDRLCDPKQPVTYTDIKILTANPIKGFNFSMEEVEIADGYTIPKPMQYKDSEYTLFAAIAKARLKSNSVLQGLVEFMQENNIDCAAFTSAVKEGAEGAINLNSVKTADEAKEILRKACFKNGKINKSVVHETSWKDYGIVSETPEHFFEERALFGSQIRRIMYGDLELTKEYRIIDELNNKTTIKTGQQIIDEYSKLIEDNLKEDFQGLMEIFDTPQSLEDFLLKEVTGNPLYPSDLTDYCKFDRREKLPDGSYNPNYGKFTKLSNPKNFAKVQQLLLSIFKNRITKQKIAGGSCVQVSVAYDYEDLKIIYEKRKDAKGNEVDVPVAAECYLPAYLESIYKKFLNPDGTIDTDKMKKLCDEKTFYALTNMIGYRIPTEGLSSTIKLRVKGFMTGYTGSSIILPKEIVSLSGSDFDIDKMFIHRYAFKTNRFGVPELITEKNANADEQNEVRNNKLITMMMSIMTLPENNMLMLKPQGFKNLEKSSMILNILNNPKYDYTVEELRNMEVKELEKMAKFDQGLSFLNPLTQVYFQQQNMIGKSLLGTWAVAKSAHNIFERSGLKFKDEFTFCYAGNRLASPDPIAINKNGIESIVSSELGSYIGASADNAKNPVLAKLGITKNNINTVVYLARLGLDSTSIAVLINNKYFNNKGLTTILTEAGYFTGDEEYEDKVAAVADILEQNGLSIDVVNRINFTDDLVNNLNTKEAIFSQQTVPVKMFNGNTEYFTKQSLCLALNMLHNSIVTPSAEQLNKLTLALRQDSQNGAVTASVAETISRIQQMESAEKSLLRDNSVFEIIEDNKPFFSTSFSAYDETTDIDTKAAFVQKFANYGVLSIRDLLKDKLPHFGATFKNAFEIGYQTKNGYISPKNAKKLEKALFFYHLSSLPFFGDETYTDKETGETKKITINNKIDFYKEKMVPLFYQTISKHPELNDNFFIQLLSADKELTDKEKEEGKVRTLRMPNSNIFTKDTKNKAQAAFLELIGSQYNDVKEFGWHLVRYGFYRYGFGFLPDGYMHLIPNEVLESIPQYFDLLNELMETVEEYAKPNGTFIEDFILNNISMASTLYTVNEKSYLNKTKWATSDDIKKELGFIPKYICLASFRKGEGVIYALARFNPNNGRYWYVKGEKEKSIVKDNQYFVKYRHYNNQIMPTMNIDESTVKDTNFSQRVEDIDMLESILGMSEEEKEELKKMKGDDWLNNLTSKLNTGLEALTTGKYNSLSEYIENSGVFDSLNTKEVHKNPDINIEIC